MTRSNRGLASIIGYYSLTIATIILFLLFFIITVYSSSLIETLENKYIDERENLIHSALQNEVISLKKIAYDWATWDDSYFFVQGKMPSYPNSNLTLDGLQNLNLNHMVYYDLDGHVVLAANRHADKFVLDKLDPLLMSDRTFILDQIKTQNNTSDSSGWITSRYSTPIFYSIFPIVKSDGSGSPLGYILVTREISPHLISQLSKRYGIEMSLLSTVRNPVNSAVENQLTPLIVKDSQQIKMTLTLKDINQKNIFSLDTIVHREIRNILMHGRIIVGITLSLTLLISLFINYKILSAKVVTRIVKLSHDVNDLRQGHQSELGNEEFKNHDEISELRAEINQMHTLIKKQNHEIISHQAEILEINKSLENKIIERTVELESTNALLAESERNYRTIVNQFPDLIFRLDINKRIQSCEGGLQDRLLFPKEQLIGRTLAELLPESLSAYINEHIDITFATEELTCFNYQLDHYDVMREYEAKLVPYGKVELHAFISDVTEEKKSIREIERLSFFDQLTGIYNRRFFQTEFERLYQPRNLPLTIIMFDVNSLKLINDAFGHIYGDHALCRICHILKKCLREDDIFARIGGDEFAIMLPNTDQEAAMHLQKRIQLSLTDENLFGMNLSVSLGYHTLKHSGMTLDDVIRNADSSMYFNKKNQAHSIRLKAIQGIQNYYFNAHPIAKDNALKTVDLLNKFTQSYPIEALDHDALLTATMYSDIGFVIAPEETHNGTDIVSDNISTSIQHHCETAYSIIKSVDGQQIAAEYTLSHHENWDGSGYPFGKKAEEIPYGSRAIHVVKNFVTIVNGGFTQQEALRELQLKSGTKYDSCIVSSFIHFIKENAPYL